jgi:ferredoxin
MKITIHRDACIGCGVCVNICPAVFELDGESIAVVKVDLVPKEEEAAAREAAQSCAVEAIEIQE